MFKRKNKHNNEYEEVVRKMNSDSELKSVDKIVFMKPRNNSDLCELATKLRDHFPIIVNFEDMDYETANRALAFLSGAVFVLSGKFEKIKEQVYLFCQKEELLDGTVKELINSL